MVQAYLRWLVRHNDQSGQRKWWFVWAVGCLLIDGWTVAASPLVLKVIGIEALAETVKLTTGLGLKMYFLWTIPDPMASYFWIGVILAVPFVKLGLLLMEIGWHFGRGHQMYWCPGRSRGQWVTYMPIN